VNEGATIRSTLLAQLGALGVRTGDCLLVHASYRAIRPIVGGPHGVIEALREAIGVGGTLVMPSMTGGEQVYDAATSPTRKMGVIAESFWRQPAVRRGDHPTSTFAAWGRWSAFIAAPQAWTPAHGPDSPVGRVCAVDGKVLLLGVGHDSNTTIHLAEALAEAPYMVDVPCLVREGQRIVRRTYAEHDHCTQRFALVGQRLRARGLQREGPFGHGAAILARSADVVAVAREILAAGITAFLHDEGGGCAECDEAWAALRARPA